MGNKSGVNLCQVPSTAALVLMQSTHPDVFKADARSHCVHKSMAIAQCHRTTAFQLKEEKWAFQLLLWHWCSSIKPETTAPFKSSQMFSRMWKSHFSTKSVPGLPLCCLTIRLWSNCFPICHYYHCLWFITALGSKTRGEGEGRRREKEERGKERSSRIMPFRHVWSWVWWKIILAQRNVLNQLALN